jgi:hypothetical protein
MASGLDLAGLSTALRETLSTDEGGICALSEEVRRVAAAAANTADPATAEHVLTCALESLVAAGQRGRELLETATLELLPPLVGLGTRSPAAAEVASRLADLAASAAQPRDTITALLEVLDAALSEQHGCGRAHRRH